mgnify:CR=1 FL=1
MISLAGRDILHSWGKFVFTGLGLGLLIGEIGRASCRERVSSPV